MIAGSKSRAAVFLAVLSAIGTLLLAMALSSRKSPGPVSAVHAQLEAVDGGSVCAACHGGWFGDMRGACGKCHEDIGLQIGEHTGLHGTLAREVADNCSTCHSEHHGADFRLVNRLAFAQAGVADPQQFDHRKIGFAMAGVHLQLACKQCHRDAETPLLAEGQQRFLGLKQDCASCHADPHAGRMQVACAICHGQETFAERAVPGHDAWLPLGGAHAAVDCRACHAVDTPHALEVMRADSHEQARTCADCHESPHTPAFVAGNAQAAATTAGAVCGVCHPIDFEKFTDPRVAVTPAQHAAGGFPLAAPHQAVACSGCHAPAADFAQRHPGRRADDCVACHQDPHGGQFATGPFAAQSCLGCHARTHFAPNEFDVAHHARTDFPLHDRHAELACKECHEDPPQDSPRRFAGTPKRCEQCHDDAHRGAFVLAADELAAERRGTCAACHGEREFAAVEVAKFAHEHFTGFAVDGAHGQIDCTGCHVPTDAPDATGRKFGRIAGGEPFGGCATCHRDPHEGRFAAEGVPSGIDGRQGCERCHDTASFRALRYGFDHDLFARFPLTGAHGQLDCEACHPALPKAEPSGRTWSLARGRDCADCHRDPHQGQFERLGRVDCNRCHKSTTTFATLSFRHNLDSRFPLGDAHARVPCASCHKPESIAGATVVRYKPLPTDCASCHGNEGGPTKRRNRG